MIKHMKVVDKLQDIQIKVGWKPEQLNVNNAESIKSSTRLTQ